MTQSTRSSNPAPKARTLASISAPEPCQPIAKAHADADVRVIDLDGDPYALRRAVGTAHAPVLKPNERRSATAVRQPGQNVDPVTWPLVLHHLSPKAKTQALDHTSRVLRPALCALIAESARTHDRLTRVPSLAVQLRGGHRATHLRATGKPPSPIEHRGFDLPPVDRLGTAWRPPVPLTCRPRRHGQDVTVE